ncbi:hypothetical protein [Altererythrobacter sp.]|uniref:hypothetical protein n=1 Tax=Altererythrobacter sp. TaxID=1872480 RepID=UPI003D00E7C3
MADLKLTIHLKGRFRVVDPDGNDLYLRGAKLQGLIALLATEDRMARTRVWLQDKLWSNHNSDHSANNLRQVLFKLRKSLGPFRDILRADRELIHLDHTQVKIETGGDGIFLEGIDIRDQEFEAWLAAKRARDSTGEIGERPETAAPKSVSPCAAIIPVKHVADHRLTRQLLIETFNEPSTSLGRFERHVADMMCRSLREFLDLDLIEPGQEADGRGVVVLNLHAYPGDEGQTGLRVAVYEGTGHGSRWADSTTGIFAGNGQDIGWPYRRLCHRACDALLGYITLHHSRKWSGPVQDADILAWSAMRRMYSMLPGSIGEATVLLQQALAVRPRGLYNALLAQLAVINYVESGGQQRDELAVRADELCVHAMAEEGTNSNVLAAVSHARLVFDNDPQAASELSRLGVLANPVNPIAWSARANALLNINEIGQAYKAAQAAQSLSQNTNFRFWTEFQVATTSIVNGRLDEAIARSERSRLLNARYRPALRYLVGLHVKAGNFEIARNTLDRLRRIEPDLSIEQFTRDDSYPVSMMRKAGLVDPFKFADL